MFYAVEYPKVLGLARVLTGDHSEAEDVAHEAFAAAFRNWDQVRDPAAWVRRVVTNKSRSSWRRRYAERRSLTRLAGGVRTAYELPAETESFWAEVRRLPLRQAQALTLFYLEDLSTVEIARVLECAEATVRVHLTRGRRALGQRLELTDE
jgi:RNA polymerase sigma-70 factor (ECF subfamily)